VLASLVSSGAASPVQAWPEFFSGPDQGDETAFPSTGSDMTGFRLEEATPESYAADMAALVEASKTVVIREEAPPIMPRVTAPESGHQYVPHPEWT
jgi:hypothetical protein